MAPVLPHSCRVLTSPWPGVYATETLSSRHYGRHSHGTYGFGALDAGAHRSSSDGRTVDAFAGDIVATNPGEMHDGRPLHVASRRWHTVYLEPDVLAAMDPCAAGGDLRIEQPAFRDPLLRHSVRRLVRRLQAWSAGRGDALACEEALVHACGLLLAGHATRRPRPIGLRAPLAAIRERLTDELLAPPSLAELAAQAGISRFQLLRRFAALHGCTPHAFVLQQRAERARSLIRQGSSLAEAAAGSGFADQSHMTRIFARQFGFTPGAWQRAAGRLQ